MKTKTCLSLVPCAFLVLAAGLNLTACLISSRPLELATKPVLLPLIALCSLAWLAEREFDHRGAFLLLAAQLFGCLGDILLTGKGFPFFAGGMGAFLVGHIFYITLFGGKTLKGLSLKTWIIAGVAILAALALMVWSIGISGVLLGPMAVYGATLMVLVFSTLMGAIKFGGSWWLTLVGAVLFLFSDSLIAMRSFGLEATPMLGFTIMSTYIAAQALLAVGAAKIIRK